MPRVYLALLTAALIALVGCDDAEPDPTDDFEAGPTLENVASDVITATYTDLRTEADALLAAVEALQATTTEASLDAARARWRAARAPWEQSEGFLFGPVDTEGLDPSLDSWPVNEQDLNAVLASGDALTPAYVAGLEATLGGFHTVEYLLFGTDGAKPASAFTARELAYLVAATTVLRDDAAALETAWLPSGEAFATELVEAGQAGSVYVSQRAAVLELVEGMVTIADEVGSGKMGGPFGDQSTLEEESRFSDNSLADFADNIRSVHHVYTGDLAGATGPGVDALVAERDAALDARVKVETDAAIAAIEAIPVPFGEAIFSHPTEVQAAIDAVLRLGDTLEGPVTAALQN
jgi:putative iron-regulated protein